jgi:predicted TIM-barrel fold metal-dependent hydrolase
MSMCFPSVTRFCGQIFWEGKDHELGLTCVKAYNDWMIEEWCGTVPGRLVPLIIVPLWDPAEAAKEIERCASLGAKGISFCENPSRLGLPSLHSEDHFWDPLFAAAQDTGIPLCLHIGSSSSTYSTAPDAPLIASFTLTPLNAYATLVDWMYSGHFLRFPKLKVCLSESGVNWIPIFLEKIDRDLDRQEWARDRAFKGNPFGDVASDATPFGGVGKFDPHELFRSNMYACVVADDYVGNAFEYLGVDNLMIESDYPHADSSWPNTVESVELAMAGLSDQDKFQLRRGNAERIFDLQPVTSL